ncbi:MAG: DUF1232 domain-containing protein [Deltaproteobacteria bacterium]|nr:DUF1232 domain-containing protein [Deltaproteobacteria bacterium]
MSELETRCLDTFPQWLRTLATDATDLAEALSLADLPEAVRRYAAGGLNYLFKSLDLIPDGIEDLGYLDDAFVLRVAAALALAESPGAEAKVPKLARLAKETALVRELLGGDYARLEAYVRKLKGGAARGRSVDEIVTDAAVRSDFLNEVSGWARSYEPPGFTRDEKNIIKLRSFLAAKLPSA